MMSTKTQPDHPTTKNCRIPAYYTSVRGAGEDRRLHGHYNSPGVSALGD